MFKRRNKDSWQLFGLNYLYNINTHPHINNNKKCRTDDADVTLPVSRPEVSVAIRPITVRSPVHTTIPRAVPRGEVIGICSGLDSKQ